MLIIQRIFRVNLAAGLIHLKLDSCIPSLNIKALITYIIYYGSIDINIDLLLCKRIMVLGKINNVDVP